jgi:L-ascorbate metabolism protein UlaG (beta-lactamase superfamily)
VGYIVEINGRRIYHAGDTDLIPEMSQIRCDVALLPMGGTYTMDADEAAQAVGRIRPQVVVPMHWGDIVGSRKDVERFVSLVGEGVRVEVLAHEK